VINLPNVSTGSELYFRSGTWSGASRKSGGPWGGAVSGRCRKTMERSGVWSGRSRSGELWLQKYGRLKRGAAFSPLMLCSHEIAYGTGMWFLPRCMKGRHGLAMRILSVRPSVKRRI